MMTRHKLLGVNVDILDEEEMYERILELSELDKCSQIVLLDTYLLIKAKLNKELFSIINASSLVIPVSRGIKNGLAFISKKQCSIIHPHTLTIRLLSYFTEYNKIVSILGGSKKIAPKTEKNIKDSFPGIKLMGVYSVNFKKDFERKLITAIQKITPSLLVVSMGRPKQEKWISKNRTHFKKGVLIGVEGFCDYVGEKMLAPYDRVLFLTGRKIARICHKPVRFFYYTLYFFYMIGYRLFKLEKV